jgi:glutathione S-transferase
MSRLVLVIGNKAYSSWSMRAWLVLKATGQVFDEVGIGLDQPDTRERILRYSPSGLVPCLIDGDATVWDSLAIAEYLAERFPAVGLWPSYAKARAHARAISAEMHAGFLALRRSLPMNVRASYEARPIAEAAIAADIARIEAIWSDCRSRFSAGGPYLYGKYSIADAMYAPVVTRFTTYRVPIGPVSAAYVATMHAHPHLRDWIAAAQAEPQRIEKYEAVAP